MAEQGGDAALRTLVRLEIQRILPVSGRSLVMGAVVTGVLAGTGAFTLPRLAFVLGVVGIVPVAGIPLNALRDKLDGGLEFLQYLPVSPGTQAMARLLALVLTALPAALLCTAALVFSLVDDVHGIVALGPVAGIFAALTLTLVAAGALVTALILRFELTQSSYAPLAFLGFVLVLDRVEERYVPDPLATLTGLLTHGWFLPAAWAVGLTVTAAVGWCTFALARSGIARFSPAKDRITW